jgi:hypothetical protein
MPGVNTLSPGVHCSGLCAISRQETSKGGDRVIQMYDNQCYYTKYIYLHIINLIKKGLTLGDTNFVLPTKAPITKLDLDLLYLDPATFRAMYETWVASPAYTLEQAQIQGEALAAAHAAVEADTVHVPVIGDGNGMHEVNTVLRWGVQVDREEEVEYPIEYINRVDRFLLPVGYDANFDHNDDENIGHRRIRNIGVREIDFIGIGRTVPPGVPLVIRFNGDFYNTLEELATAMGKTVAEISCNETGLTESDATGGRKKRKTKRSRKSRRTRRR